MLAGGIRTEERQRWLRPVPTLGLGPGFGARRRNGMAAAGRVRTPDDRSSALKAGRDRPKPCVDSARSTCWSFRRGAGSPRASSRSPPGSFARALSSTHRLYMMTRHFVWLVPLINLLVFLGLGVLLAWRRDAGPARAGWWSPRLIVALALLPVLVVAGPKIYVEAWLILASGDRVSRRPGAGAASGPCAAMAGAELSRSAGTGPDPGGVDLRWRLAQAAARSRPSLAAGRFAQRALDRAGHGAGRSPEPLRLSARHHARRWSGWPARGIRFDEARATAPWTLPSHASFFTGRWPHELGVQWLTPLRGELPDAGRIPGGSRLCDRGFRRQYRLLLVRHRPGSWLYSLRRLRPRATRFPPDRRPGRRRREDVRRLDRSRLDQGWFHRLRDVVHDWFFSAGRKSAEQINRDFLDWFARRREPGRPFFVFLNYFDAHTPYVLPPGARHRFGVNPETKDDFRDVLMDWGVVDKLRLPRRYWSLARDAYDNCVAYLDERLGELFDELQRRGVLDRTLVIITSDHGEGLGEHDLFDAWREPLPDRDPRAAPDPDCPRIARPGRWCARRSACATCRRPSSTWSAWGPGRRSRAGRWPGCGPIPRRSRSRRDRGSDLRARVAQSSRSQSRSIARLIGARLISLAEGDFVYIRNEGDGTEELFNERDDPRRDSPIAPAPRPCCRSCGDFATTSRG